MEAKKSKILVVEDEGIVRESLRDWLTEDGYDVECVDTGEGALEIIKKEEIAVVVLDLRLPGIDGLQVFEKAKEIKPETKGVIITAFPSKETLDKGRRLGILNYLSKPLKVEDLEKIISAALGELGGKEMARTHLWLEIGAVSYRLCDRDYECDSCPLAQEIQDTFETVVLIGRDEVKKLQQSPGGQRFCRFGSVRLVHRDKPYLD